MTTTAFSPFRAVGSVCSDAPIASTLLYGEPVLMVPLGHSFLLYRGKELSMLRGGPSFENPVSCVATTGRFRFAGEGSQIHAFSHHKPLWTLPHAAVTKSKVKALLARDDILVSYGSDNIIVVRHAKTGDIIQEMMVEGNERVTCMIFPEGYTNKLLIGTDAGALQLFNFRSGKLLLHHRVEGSAISSHASSSSSSSLYSGRIASLTSSRYKDIIAFGTSTGRLVVLNLASLEEICTFRHDGVAVTAVAFREDKDGFVVSGTSAGEIAVWDLQNRSLDGVLTRSKQVASRLEAFETPHTEAVHSLISFSPKGALLVSAGGDNAIMQFRFDTVDGLGLLVRERRGHMSECTAVRFYNSDLIVTGGADQALRVTHVFSDRASWELSQGKLGRRGRDAMVGRETLKLSPSTRIETNPTRNYQWGSIVSLHEASALLCSWRMDTRAFENKLSGIQTGMHVARCVRLSGCGNFAVVGYSSGHVTVINLQNKSLKQLSSGQQQHKIQAHAKSVEAVEVARGNTTVVSSGLDGTMCMWDLMLGKLLKKVNLGLAVTLSCLHEPSSLFICVQHLTINVYNCDPSLEEVMGDDSVLSTPVRSFTGHRGAIVSLAITPDSLRHVVSASADSGFMIWDLAAGACVGSYRLSAPITSLAFHPDGLFLATTHLGERGSFLWTNNLRYGFVPDVIENPLTVDFDALPMLHCPSVHVEDADEDADAQQENESEEQRSKRAAMRRALEQDGNDAAEDEVDLFDATKDTALASKARKLGEKGMLNAIECNGLRTSGLPRTVWFNMTVLDQIKEKNQALVAPKKKDVPFFLPTTSELRPTFIVQPSPAGQSDRKATKPAGISASGDIQSDLLQGRYDAVMTRLIGGGSSSSAVSAADIDLQIQSLVDFISDVEYTEAEKKQMRLQLGHLLKFFTHHLRLGRNVDLVEGMIASALKAHGAFFIQASNEQQAGAQCDVEEDEGAEAEPLNLVEAMEELHAAQEAVRLQLQHLVGYPNCMLSYFTGAMV